MSNDERIVERMQKLKPPKGWRILKANEILLPDDLFYQPRYPKQKANHDAGRRASYCATKYGYTSCYIRKISKPKKSRPNKPLYAIIYDAIAGKELCNAWPTLDKQTRRPYIRAANAALREVRRRMANERTME